MYEELVIKRFCCWKLKISSLPALLVTIWIQKEKLFLWWQPPITHTSWTFVVIRGHIWHHKVGIDQSANIHTALACLLYIQRCRREDRRCLNSCCARRRPCCFVTGEDAHTHMQWSFAWSFSLRHLMSAQGGDAAAVELLQTLSTTQQQSSSGESLRSSISFSPFSFFFFFKKCNANFLPELTDPTLRQVWPSACWDRSVKCVCVCVCTACFLY